MLKSNSFRLAIIALVIVSFLCKQYNATEIAQSPADAIEQPIQIVHHVMANEEQNNGTPQKVLDQETTFLDSKTIIFSQITASLWKSKNAFFGTFGHKNGVSGHFYGAFGKI